MTHIPLVPLSAFLLRSPANSKSLNIALSVRLEDLSAVRFLTATDPAVAEYFHARCRDEAELVAKNPLSILAFAFEERFYRYTEWMVQVIKDLGEIETVTGMVPALWRLQLPASKTSWLSDHGNQLRQLHHTSTELQHCSIVMDFASKLGKLALEAAGLLDDLRSKRGLEPADEQSRGLYEEHVRFFPSENWIR